MLYDLESLRIVADGSNEFLKELMVQILEVVPETIQEMQDAAIANNPVAVKNSVHKMKPAIHSLGVVSVLNDLEDIQKVVDEKRPLSQAKHAMDHLQITMSKVFDGLRSEFEIE